MVTIFKPASEEKKMMRRDVQKNINNQEVPVESRGSHQMAHRRMGSTGEAALKITEDSYIKYAEMTREKFEKVEEGKESETPKSEQSTERTPTLEETQKGTVEEKPKIVVPPKKEDGTDSKNSTLQRAIFQQYSYFYKVGEWGGWNSTQNRCPTRMST